MNEEYISCSEIEEVIRQKKGNVEIKFPDVDKIKELRPWVDEVLKEIGVKRAFVSNGSTIGDFHAILDEEDLAEMSAKWEFTVVWADYLWEVAARLKEKVSPDSSK